MKYKINVETEFESGFKLTSRVKISRAVKEERLGYSSRVLTLGSCFSNNLATQLAGLGFDIVINPFGTLYNPLSMREALARLCDKKFRFEESDLREANGYYVSLLHHSRYRHHKAASLVKLLNKDLREGRKRLLSSSHLMVTFGSSFVYRLKSSGAVVANCHKLPSEEFCCTLASFEELKESFGNIVEKVLALNPTLKIILTVSPIRYLGYGTHESQLGKARLLLLVEYLRLRFPESIRYFPAYEIMLDELRDYRFYEEDLVHPSPLAERIILERFLETWGNEEERPQRVACHKLQQLLHHQTKDPQEEPRHHEAILQWIDRHREELPEDKIIERMITYNRRKI